MKPLPRLSIIAVSALLCISHAAAAAGHDPNPQAVLDVPAAAAADSQQSDREEHNKLDLERYLFPSEVDALESHEEYELLRLALPLRGAEQTDTEASLLQAAGMPDMRSYISHMAQVGVTSSLCVLGRLTNLGLGVKLLSLDIWHASSTHLDILLPSSLIKHQLLSALPPHYSASAQVIINSFPELYISHAREVAFLANRLDDSETGMDVLMKGRSRSHKGKKGKLPHGGGKKHRKPHPKPTPSPDPPPPPRTPPPPPPGSNRTTPDIYNTTDIHTLFHDAYHPLSVLYDFQDELATTFGHDAVSVFSLGMSAEGREIRGMKIHKKRNETAEAHTQAEGLRGPGQEGSGTQRQVRGKGRTGNKGLVEDEKIKEFYIQGGQHAREATTVLYFAHHLLVAAFIDENKQAIDLLERFQFTLVPTINPDGYVYNPAGAQFD
ncbi:hypothetical protein QFC21_000810 [Naganishia friedmannii]|uniref:Uncharacterized protein n=1 Tax=Naganishia friedmannii TaxID=89922 RepID=A0ACC2W7S3_9TREE|nr:hypothetical protein QFC21_000810 [Naganishia friedmannii]